MIRRLLGHTRRVGDTLPHSSTASGPVDADVGEFPPLGPSGKVAAEPQACHWYLSKEVLSAKELPWLRAWLRKLGEESLLPVEGESFVVGKGREGSPLEEKFRNHPQAALEVACLIADNPKLSQVFEEAFICALGALMEPQGQHQRVEHLGRQVEGGLIHKLSQRAWTCGAQLAEKRVFKSPGDEFPSRFLDAAVKYLERDYFNGFSLRATSSLFRVADRLGQLNPFKLLLSRWPTDARLVAPPFDTVQGEVQDAPICALLTDLSCVKALLEARPEAANDQDSRGNTPLHYQFALGPVRKMAVITALLEAGSDPDVPNRDGLSPRNMSLDSEKELRKLMEEWPGITPGGFHERLREALTFTEEQCRHFSVPFLGLSAMGAPGVFARALAQALNPAQALWSLMAEHELGPQSFGSQMPTKGLVRGLLREAGLSQEIDHRSKIGTAMVLCAFREADPEFDHLILSDFSKWLDLNPGERIPEETANYALALCDCAEPSVGLDPSRLMDEILDRCDRSNFQLRPSEENLDELNGFSAATPLFALASQALAQKLWDKGARPPADVLVVPRKMPRPFPKNGAEKVRWALDHGADIRARNAQGEGVLECWLEHPEAFQLLVDRGAQPSPSSAILRQTRSLEVLKMALALGLDPNQEGERRGDWPPLHRLFRSKYEIPEFETAVRVLVEGGADPHRAYPSQPYLMRTLPSFAEVVEDRLQSARGALAESALVERPPDDRRRLIQRIATLEKIEEIVRFPRAFRQT